MRKLFNRDEFKTRIRNFLKDIERKNRLLDNELESTDTDMDLAIDLALLDANTIEPICMGQFTEESFDDKSVLLLLPAVVANLLESESFNQARNQLNYQDGGAMVQASDKEPTYTKLAMMHRQIFEKRLNPYKKNMAFAEGWGGVYSPYLYVNAGILR